MNAEHDNIPETGDVEPSEISYARQYFLALTARSNSLRDQMQSASTKTKQNYFRKKLKKNNIDAINILSRLNIYEQSKILNISAKSELTPFTQNSSDDEYR